MSDYVKNTTTLQRKLGLGSKYTPDWEGDSQKLIVGQLAEKLEPLLADAGDHEGVALVRKYDEIYRGQSQFAVHAGLSTFRLYTRLEGNWASIEPNPSSPFDDVGHISLLCTLNLAEHVFERFGIATNELESIRAGTVADGDEDSS